LDQDSELRVLLGELLRSQALGVLATHDGQAQYCSLVAFAATENLSDLLFATTRATRKYANLSAYPRVSMLIDSRSNQEADFHEAIAVTAVGVAREVEDACRQDLLELYLAKHPHLEDFVTAPTCALLRLQVDGYVAVRKFQQVMELRIQR
jgi:nitroimidazol reductase NimA-like FMN-containing flavoprotein (pyridoxamine 5'-phosphate oxidase superfamily)